jgi:hypothetical protein
MHAIPVSGSKRQSLTVAAFRFSNVPLGQWQTQVSHTACAGWSTSVPVSRSEQSRDEETPIPPVASNASAEAFTAPTGPIGDAKFSHVRVDGKLFSSFNPTRLTLGVWAPGPLRGGTFTIKPTNFTVKPK